MPTTSPSKLARRRSISSIINRLSASIRGQIFLCNLDVSITTGLVDPAKVTDVFSSVKYRDIRYMHEDALLGHLRAFLNNPSSGLLFQVNSISHFPAFSKGKPILTVMKYADFLSYYADPIAAISGHAFLSKLPGALTRSYRSSATTNPICWVAPTCAFPDPTLFTSNAEASRDLLGLVHHRKDISLVALIFYPPSDQCYRPTAIESLPNARFRQCDPNNPTESRWGFTIDLGELDKHTPATSITGMPELILKTFRVSTCKSPEFYYIGETRNDRDTAFADDCFLSALKRGESIDTVVSRLKSHLAP